MSEINTNSPAKSVGLVLAAVTVVAAAVTVLLGLKLASGVGADYFDSTTLLIGSAVTLILTVAAAYVWWPAGVLALLATCVAWWLGIRETLHRIQESLHSDSLGGMGQRYTLTYAVIGLLLVAAAAGLGRLRGRLQGRRAGAVSPRDDG